MAFAIPAWVLGLIVAQIVFAVVASVMRDTTYINISPYLSAGSIVLATALGVIIPVLAAIVPIRVRTRFWPVGLGRLADRQWRRP